MAYWIPKPTKCTKCGHESFSDPNNMMHPLFSEICYPCLKSFLIEYGVGEMKPEAGSDRKQESTTVTD